MMLNAPLEAALLAVVLVAAIAACAGALFWSTVVLERWLDGEAAVAPATVVLVPRPAFLDENVNTDAA
jgi:hypothetical protein